MSGRRRAFYAYEKFQQGVMPESGGLMEQSAHWIEVFQAIDDGVASVKRERPVHTRDDSDGD
jgi:hypothetical protein